MTIKIANAAANAMLDVLADAVDGGSGAGSIEIRSGTQPANADTAATGTLLVTFTLTDPAFDAAASRSVAIDADPDIAATAAATGTATWARCKDSSGATIFDGAVGTSGTDFIISSTAITTGQSVTLTTGTLSLPA